MTESRPKTQEELDQEAREGAEDAADMASGQAILEAMKKAKQGEVVTPGKIAGLSPEQDKDYQDAIKGINALGELKAGKREAGKPDNSESIVDKLLIICKKCGNGMLPEANFCSNCGETAPKKEEMVKCKKCGAETPDSTFCTECGSKLKEESMIKCKKCGAETPDSAFCTNCGAGLKS